MGPLHSAPLLMEAVSSGKHPSVSMMHILGGYFGAYEERVKGDYDGRWARGLNWLPNLLLNLWNLWAGITRSLKPSIYKLDTGTIHCSDKLIG